MHSRPVSCKPDDSDDYNASVLSSETVFDLPVVVLNEVGRLKVHPEWLPGQDVGNDEVCPRTSRCRGIDRN